MVFHGYTTAPIVAPNIYDKVRPLPGYLIEPLKPFPPDEDGTRPLFGDEAKGDAA